MKRTRHKEKGLDWTQVRERLAGIAAATEEGMRLSPEQTRAVLEERARVLARVPAVIPDAAMVLEVVTFIVAGERYAIGAKHVREVVRLTDLRPVPGAPAPLGGVVNLRGEILAVFDPRTFFGIEAAGRTSTSRILVLGGDRVEFGLLADAVHEVATLRIDDVLPPPATVADPGREYLRGVTADALIVLDGEVLLHDRRLFIDVGEEPGSAFGGEKP